MKSMFNYKLNHIAFSLFTAFFLIALLFLPQRTAFAGDPGCQSGYSSQNRGNGGFGRPSEAEEKRQFAAAQSRNENGQPPPNGLGGGETPLRSGFSFALSILVLLGGIWTLLVLLRQRFGKNFEQKPHRLPKLLGFAFKPSFALSVFGFLFLVTIIGSVLTKPIAVTAEKREKPDKSKMIGLMNPSSKPVFKTAQQIGGDGITQIGAPVFDAAGNRYVRGGFTGTLTIGATTLTATKDFDLFVAKYDASGNALWARQASGSTSGAIPATLAVEGATALSVDAGGNVYIGGSFVKTLNLQGGANANITLNDNGAPGINYESFVAKYDANGNLLWAKGGNTNSPKNLVNLEDGQNGIDQIVFDASGNPYIAGFVSGNQFLGSAFTNQGLSEIMLAKLNPNTGAIVWKQIIGGTEDDNGLDLKIDGANNLYLIGNFGSPSITFPNGDTYTNPGDPNNFEGDSTDTFIAKFDQTGTNLWTKDISNDTTVGASQIAVNAAGEIFMTGYFFNSVTFGATVLTENEGGTTQDEASFGGYITKMDGSGNFVWAKQFGGIGAAIALDGSGRVYIAGTFYDGGVFGGGTANVENLASFGGEDLFVARYDVSGNFDFAKAIAGAGSEGTIAIGNPSAQDGKTENNYDSLGIAYNPATGTVFVSGDFQKAVALDCLTLTTTGTNIHSYLAELTADNEATSCRIWNGLDADDNNFDSPDNWNGGIIPTDNNSIYVPYTGNSNDNPIYNPAGIGVILNNLTVSDDRTLTLNRDLPITGKLWLLGGFVNTGADRLLDLTDTATANRIADADGSGGYVIGKMRKEIGSTNPFVFPVGTSNGYSPVDVNPQIGIGASLAVKAVQQPQPSFAAAPNRINRYWTLDKAGKGFLTANLTFHYLQTDVVGSEFTFRLFKIEPPNAPELQTTATIDTTANTATVNDVSQFSDWTLAQPLAPTAADISISGRVHLPRNFGLTAALVTLTDAAGISRTTHTNKLGGFRFNDVAAGQTYVISVRAKGHQFAPQILTATEDITNLIFIPLE